MKKEIKKFGKLVLSKETLSTLSDLESGVLRGGEYRTRRCGGGGVSNTGCDVTCDLAACPTRSCYISPNYNTGLTSNC